MRVLDALNTVIYKQEIVKMDYDKLIERKMEKDIRDKLDKIKSNSSSIDNSLKNKNRKDR